MKLLIADDHNLFREAIVQYIERAEPDISVLVAKDLHEAVEILNGNSDIDLVLLDMRMPGMNGLQGLEKLRSAYPGTKVALLSGLAEEDDVKKALAMGACGYFPKTLSGNALLAGIHQVMAGQVYVATNHNTGRIMPSHYSGNGETGVAGGNAANPPLTPREKEVLEFLKRGESNKDIARALDLQVVTVKLHVRGICRKLGAKNRTQAALAARERGL